MVYGWRLQHSAYLGQDDAGICCGQTIERFQAADFQQGRRCNRIFNNHGVQLVLPFPLDFAARPQEKSKAARYLGILRCIE